METANKIHRYYTFQQSTSRLSTRLSTSVILKESYKKNCNMEKRFLAGSVAIGQGVMVLNQNRVDLDWPHPDQVHQFLQLTVVNCIYYSFINYYE